MSGKGCKRSIVAEMLGLTEKRVKQLTDEGVLKEVVSGHYKLAESIQAYITYLQNKLSDRDETSDYNTEKAKLTKAKREKEEAELALMRGELHRSADVEFVVGTMIVSFRAKMLTVPNKALPEIKAAADDNEILSILKHYITDALLELSEFDIHKYDDEEGEQDFGN